MATRELDRITAVLTSLAEELGIDTSAEGVDETIQTLTEDVAVAFGV